MVTWLNLKKSTTESRTPNTNAQVCKLILEDNVKGEILKIEIEFHRINEQVLDFPCSQR